MHAATVQSQMAGNLVESLLGQAQQSQTDLAMKLARVSMAANLQSPAGNSDASGAGSLVDMVG
jgi:hypothetical protein